MAALLTVILRELCEAARRKWTHVARFLYGAMLVIPVLVCYANMRGQAQGLGARLFAVFVVWQIILVSFVAPASAAGSVVAERLSGTLGLILLTRLRPWSIATGKLAVEFGKMLLVLVSGIPVLFFIMMFGGVSVAQILQAFVVTAVFMLLLIALGLAVSCRVDESRKAILWTYFLILVFGCLLPVLLPYAAAKWEFLEPANVVFENLHPGYALGASALGGGNWVPVMRYVALTLLVCMLLIVSATRGIACDQSSSGELLPKWRVLARWRRTRRRGEVRGHAICWRDSRSGWMGVIGFFLLIAALLAFWLPEYPNWGRRLRALMDFWFPAYILVWYATYISIIIRASSLFTSEKENQTFPLLLVSPLSDREIVKGKFLTLVREYGPFVYLMLGTNFLIFLVVSTSGQGRDFFNEIGLVVYPLWTTAGPIIRLLFFATTSLWWSAISPNSTRAFLANMGTQLALHFLIPMLVLPGVTSKGGVTVLLVLGYVLQLVVAAAMYGWMTGRLRAHAARE